MDSRAQDLKDQGNKAFAEGRNEDAVRLYTQALELGSNAILYSNRAAAYLKLVRHEEALKDATAAISLDPAYIKAYLRKGDALVALGKLGEAREAFGGGLSRDPSSALLQERLSELEDDARAHDLKEQGNKAFAEDRHEDAIRLYSEAVVLSPTAVLYSNRAAARLKLGRYEEAVRDASAAILVDRSYIKAYARKASALMEQGKLNLAMEALEAGLEVDPTSALLKERVAEVEARSRRAEANPPPVASPKPERPPRAKEEDRGIRLGECSPLIESFIAAWAKELDGSLAERPVPRRYDGLDSLLTALRGTKKLDRRIGCVDALISGIWATLAAHPSLPRLTGEMLRFSAAFGTLFLFLKSLCALSSDVDDAVKKGGRLLAVAITGAFQSPADAAGEAKLISLLRWFVERCSDEPLRLADPWGVRDSFANKHPMMTAVLAGPPALVSLIASKGVPVDASSFKAPLEQWPLWAAYKRGRADTFAKLRELEADYNYNFLIAALRYFAGCCACFPEQGHEFSRGCSDHCAKRATPARLEMLRGTLTKSSSFLFVQSLDKNGDLCSALDYAMDSGSGALIDLILQLGVAPRFTGCSTLESAIARERYELVETLVKKHKLAESNSQYTEESLHRLARAIAVEAIRSYPPNPRYKGHRYSTDTNPHPDRSKIIDVILGSGLKACWDKLGQNALLATLYPGADEKEPHGALSEDHTLELLERFRKAGWNVGSVFKKDITSSSPQGNGLAVLAGPRGHLRVFDYAFQTAGCAVDGFFGPPGGDSLDTLDWCLNNDEPELAERMLVKYKAKATKPGLAAKFQPLYALLMGREYSDAQTASLLRLMIANSPDLLELDCYREKGVPGTITGTVTWTPIHGCVYWRRAKTLELLLTAFPAAKDMVCQQVTVNDEKSGGYIHETAFHVCVYLRAWECVAVLMRMANPSVTMTREVGVNDSGKWIRPKTALDDIKAAAASSHNHPPRALVAAFEAAAKREWEAAKGSASGAVGIDEGLTTNAFEVPEDADHGNGSGAGAMPHGTKKGGKKKAGKKKGGKGKKKKGGKVAGASGTGGAAASVDGGSSSDEDEVDDFEEPDDNLVDSRYAPSLDVMLAEREREKSRAEASAPSDK